MTIDPPSATRRRAPRAEPLAPRRWRSSSARVILFALGVALGLALDDRPVPGGTQTFVRTLEPVPQQP